MTYEEAIKKFPELGNYSADDLNLILTGAKLVLRDDDAVDALVSVVEHMTESLNEYLIRKDTETV